MVRAVITFIIVVMVSASAWAEYWNTGSSNQSTKLEAETQPFDIIVGSQIMRHTPDIIINTITQ
jgi:hypothetical protein